MTTRGGDALADARTAPPPSSTREHVVRCTIVAVLLTLAVGLLSAALFLRHRLAHPRDTGDLEAVIDKEAARHVRADATHALVIGVFKDGAAFVKGYGTTSAAVNTPPDGATVFQIASLSKLFTASTMQILADEGVLGTDTTLGEAIGDIAELSPAARAITLRQLATHTSGFPRVPQVLVDEATAAAGETDLMLDPYVHLEPERMFAYLANADDMGASGSFDYSNFGMGLLGHVMEHVTGEDLETLVTEKLLAPLGMADTAITLAPSLTERLAQGHDKGGAPVRIWTFTALAGAGAFASTVDDLLTYVAANVAGEGALAGTLAKMRAPQPGGKSCIGWMQPTFLDRLAGNRTAVWHNGMVGGYASYLSVDAASGTGVVMLSSRALDLTMLGTMLTRRVRTQSRSSR